MYHYNSTIKIKTGICKRCEGTNKVPVTAGLCQTHYREQMNSKSILRAGAKERGELEPVKILIDDMDIIFSQLIRLMYVDEYGNVQCYTCPEVKNWKKIQNGHFISRAKMPTRYSVKNCRPQCKSCNEHNDGEEKVFAERLEAEEPGIVEMLKEQSTQVQDYSREELKFLIGDTTRKVKNLMKKIIYQ
jgi:hypothetical protein